MRLYGTPKSAAKLFDPINDGTSEVWIDKLIEMRKLDSDIDQYCRFVVNNGRPLLELDYHIVRAIEEQNRVKKKQEKLTLFESNISLFTPPIGIENRFTER